MAYIRADHFSGGGSPAREQLEVGVAIGIAVVAKLLRSDKYTLLPRALIADMLETPPAALYYIDTFRRAHAAKIAVEGVPAPDKITKRMLFQACSNSDPWSQELPLDREQLASPEGKVTEVKGIYRIQYGGFGFKGMETCAVDVIQQSGGFEIRVQLATGNLMPPGSAGINKVPIWYLFDGGTTLSAFADQK